MTLFLISIAYTAALLLVLSLVETAAFTISRDRFTSRRHPPPLKLSNDDDEDAAPATPSSTNVLGTSLSPCCTNVRDTGIGTGFYRNGFCSTGEQDLGRHTICVQVTDEFLKYSASVGNDLSTPAPQYSFPGLKDGDIWCLCAQRWAQAYMADKAPKLYLQATHEKTLDYVPFHILREYALDKTEADEALDDLNKKRERLKKLL
mmetsp:Transcript_20701/g.37612  ORF Transcript_20701/g.37612 Transcript_20701/m.37612 type:complete len:204 (+) Transcript_20701:49-660(+)